MSRTIKRTYFTSIIKVNEIKFNKNDEPKFIKLNDVDVDGKISYEKANKKVRELYPNKKVAIMGIEEIEEELSLSYSDFKKYAKIEVERQKEI